MARLNVNVIVVPIDQIDPNPWNPNVQSAFTFEKEKESIETYGFIDPVTGRQKGDGRYEIIDGEHRWKAAKEVGLTELPFNVIVIDDARAKKLTIVLNELKGKPDTEILAALLGDIKLEMGDDVEFLKGLPFNESDLHGLLSHDEIDWQSKDGAPEGIAPEKGDWRVVTIQLPKDVAARFKEQLERVKKLLHPDEDAARTSPITAVEAMTRVLAEAPDEKFRV